MPRARIATVVFCVLAGLLAGSAQAAESLKYTDEPGDAFDGRASMDIVSVTHDLRQVNKAGPPSIVFEMELAAPPEGTGHAYGVSTQLEGCGDFDALYRPGAVVYEAVGIAAADFYIACEEDSILPAQFRIDGNVLRWAIALDGLPAKYRSGKLGTLTASTEVVDPATGEVGPGEEGILPMDAAASDQTWSY